MTIRDPDPELTELGRRGGQLCAEHLKRILVHLAVTRKRFKADDATAGESGDEIRVRILVSPMKRALQSADILASFLTEVQEIKVLPHIHEVGGLYHTAQKIEEIQGATREEIATYPRLNPAGREGLPEYDTRALRETGGWWQRKRETESEARLRAKLLCNEFRDEQYSSAPVDVIIVICHGLFLDLMWKCILWGNATQASSTKQLGFVTHNWGVSVLDIKGDQVTVQSVNENAFIPLASRHAHRIKHQHKTAF